MTPRRRERREMTPGVSGCGTVEEQRLERQMGCIAGFLQLFDRHHVLSGRRHCSARRLPTSPSAESTAPSEGSEASSSSFFKESHPPPSSPEPWTSSPESRQLPLRVFEFKDGARTSWRIREAPRLSLDSRVVVDAKGTLCSREIRTAVPVASGNQSDASEAAKEQRRSPSVVARLIGINALPSAGGAGGAEPDRTEPRRSASESWFRRDPSYYRSVDAGLFGKPPTPPPVAIPISDEEFFKTLNLAQFRHNNAKKPEPPPRPTPLLPLQRKRFFDAEDFFPEAKRSGTLYGEIERRLRMRGMEEPAKELETLKQIVEALQLQGLLHSKPSDHRTNGLRNLIYNFQGRVHRDAPIVIMKTASKPPRRPSTEPPLPRSAATCQSAPPFRRGVAVVDRSIKVVNERRNRTPRSPESPRSPAHRRPLNAVPQKSPQPQRRISAVGSPKSSPKRAGLDPLAVRSPRSRTAKVDAPTKDRVYPAAEDDIATIISESSISASSPLDFKRPRAEYRSGRSLLERCDKLLHSIAAFTGEEQVAAADQQPSPVSVLDSSSYLGEDGSPSPLAKRSIDFKDQSVGDWEEQSSPAASTNHGDWVDGPDAVDRDYAYVRDVLRASDHYGDASDAVYANLEKRCCRRRCGASKAARLHRRLVFDTVAEILERDRSVCTWDAFLGPGSPPTADEGGEAVLRRVWAEVRRIREGAAGGDHDRVACGAVRKDMAADGWGQPAAEISNAVLQIERLIFKDLVVESIRDVAGAAHAPRPLLSRRKLVI